MNCWSIRGFMAGFRGWDGVGFGLAIVRAKLGLAEGAIWGCISSVGLAVITVATKPKYRLATAVIGASLWGLISGLCWWFHVVVIAGC